MKYLFLLMLFTTLLLSCEETFEPEIRLDVESIVVEGYIEAGEEPTPPYVILTRSRPFFSVIGQAELENAFIHDAKVFVTDGEKSVQLTELCLNELSPAQQAIAGTFFGFQADNIGFNFCAYLDLSFDMLGEVGKTYTLSIEVEEQKLKAVTTIPSHVPIDSMRFIIPPGEPNDTLTQLRAFVTDPPDQLNYYRYQTKINDEPLLNPDNSVAEDRFFNGKSFEFPLAKAEPPNTIFDLDTYGLYRRGDKATIKWISIDQVHYEFWNTLEFNAANQGPFSSYTRVSSNIEGGLGIWGGLSASYYEQIVPE